MIFVTVGTTSFPFPRLIRMVNYAIRQLHTREKLIIQTNKKEISFPIMVKYMHCARVIVCHGGPATIFLALQYGKNKPFVIPRRTELSEHTDNHQVHFASRMIKENFVAGSLEKDCTQELIAYLSLPTPTIKKPIEASKNLISQLRNYSEQM